MLAPLLAAICIVPLVVFYLWMFRDMTENTVLSDAERFNWTWAFLLLNVFAAAVYFLTYRRPR